MPIKYNHDWIYKIGDKEIVAKREAWETRCRLRNLGFKVVAEYETGARWLIWTSADNTIRMKLDEEGHAWL